MTYTADTSNRADLLDSREIIDRYTELSTQEGLYSVDEYNEVIALINLIDEGETLADWEYGVTLIRDSYFVEYAQQLADDLGVIDSNATAGQWPLYCIDWERAAEELQMDYTPLEYDGVLYWGR